MHLQLANPTEHRVLVGLPWTTPLDDWPMDNMVLPIGPHRHVVRFLEHGDVTYVLKELPEKLVRREHRLLRSLAEADLPTAAVIGGVYGRGDDCNGEGVLITRHIDFSLPYRVLLSGRGLQIPYLGDRLLDSLVGLLVRLHLAGFFWGDCSLSNTLFRRDAGALTAFIIDLETGELHDKLSDGQRRTDLGIAVENVAGGLLDLQAGGHLAAGIDPFDTADQVEARYHELWNVLTAEEVFAPGETHRIDQRLRQLHDLGFDVAEVDIKSDARGDSVRFVPRVVESGFHGRRLMSLTGLHTGENQARRMLDDITKHGLALEHATGKKLPEAVVAARWLDQVYEPVIDNIPADLAGRLEPAEIYHHVLEHRWFLSEAAGLDVGMDTAVASYVETVLRNSPDEHLVLDPPTTELPIIQL